MHFKTNCFVYKKAKRAFLNFVTLYCFCDINLTISPLDRPIIQQNYSMVLGILCTASSV